jgi:hypothetical protein
MNTKRALMRMIDDISSSFYPIKWKFDTKKFRKVKNELNITSHDMSKILITFKNAISINNLLFNDNLVNKKQMENIIAYLEKLKENVKTMPVPEKDDKIEVEEEKEEDDE